MVLVINSTALEVPRIFPQRDEIRPIKLKGFPTFYNSKYEYIMPINLWMNHLANGRNAKDLNSAVRALKRYWKFLEREQLEWDIFPKSKYLKPTYRFRNDDLVMAARAGEIQFSTASLYMLHVINFYEWCIANRLLESSTDSKPFEYELIRIRNQGMLNHLRPHYLVTSTDLRIKIPKKSDIQSLNPLTREDLQLFSSELSLFGIEFIIHQLLQIHSGLRIEEACTFPLSIAQDELAMHSYTEVSIGPVNGVSTKFGKQRKIEIPAKLSALINAYANSNRRKERLRGQQIDYLLVSKNGTKFSSNNVHQSFRRLRQAIREKHGIPFKHKSHDLRATYCTYRLSSLLEHGLQKNAVLQMMAWMGHNNESTTWQYVDFLEREQTVKNATSLLDRILEEAIYD
ncbi:site-specific integrase (plasmid) [Shewanella sp. LC6]|uniref:site-specific integrase n=2 Tax=unclassified Shewanella TaxID=196818 RepID=UPI00112BB5F4|nr:site-specific integrase [Shewanella sp. LC6]QQK62430.1 site-specific integrase [Shewanella sp. LC6]TPE60641.1 site-specific integrase [Shewanella sp. LC2]